MAQQTSSERILNGGIRVDCGRRGLKIGTGEQWRRRLYVLDVRVHLMLIGRCHRLSAAHHRRHGRLRHLEQVLADLVVRYRLLPTNHGHAGRQNGQLL